MPLYSISYTWSYVFVFIFLTLLTIPISNSEAINRTYKAVQEKIAFLLLFIFLGLRGFIYSDWYQYYNGFLEAPTLFSSRDELNYFFYQSPYGSVWEKGFNFFLITCKTLIPQWWFFQLFCFLSNFLVDIYFIKQFTKKYLVLGLCFYFIFGGMRYDINLMRNSKAIMLFILSLRYAADRKIIPYMVINALGILFHTSAVVFLPLYFLFTRIPNKKIIWGMFVIGNILYLMQIKWCTPIIEFGAMTVGGLAAKKAVQYLSNELWATGYGITIGYLERSLTFILVMHYYERFLKNKYNIPILHCMFIYIFSYLYLSEMSILTQRIPLLFLFAYWPLYVQIYGWQNKSRKFVFLLLFFSYSVMKIISGGQALPNAYDNILFPKYTLEQRSTRLHRFQREFNSFGGEK